MSIKMPSPEDMDKAQLKLEYQSQVDRYTQMIEAGQGTPVLWYNLGVALLGMENWEEARFAFGKAIELQPEMMQAHVNFGAASFQLGDLESAVESLKKALTFQEDFLPARSNLGIALMRLGRHKESIIEMEKVLEAEPKHPAALGALTLCYEALNNEEEAVKYRKLASEAGVRFNS